MMRLIFATPFLLLLCVGVIKVKSQTVIHQEKDGLYYNLEKLVGQNEKNWEKLRLLSLYAYVLFDKNKNEKETEVRFKGYLTEFVESKGAMVDRLKKKISPHMKPVDAKVGLYQYLGYLHDGVNDFIRETTDKQDEHYVVYVTTEKVGDEGFRFPGFFTEFPDEKHVLFYKDEDNPYLTFLNELDDKKLDQLNNLLMVGSVSYNAKQSHEYVVQGLFSTLNGFILKNQQHREYKRLSVPLLAFTALVMPVLHPGVQSFSISFPPYNHMMDLLAESLPRFKKKLQRYQDKYSFGVEEMGRVFPEHKVINGAAPSEHDDNEGTLLSDVPEDSDQLVDAFGPREASPEAIK